MVLAIKLRFSMGTLLYLMTVVAFSAFFAAGSAYDQQPDGTRIFDPGEFVRSFFLSLAIFAFTGWVFWMRDQRIEREKEQDESGSANSN